MPKIRVVLYSNEDSLYAECQKVLGKSFAVLTCDSPRDLGKLAAESKIHILIADFRFVSDGGHSQDRILELALTQIPDVTIVMLTDEECPEPLERRAACSGILHHRGDFDWQNIVDQLQDKISNSTEMASLLPPTKSPHDSELDSARQRIMNKFETNTPQIRKMLTELKIAAQHDVTILLIGETGSGKTFLSKLVHEVSPRNDEPFLPVACGALPRELIESELFGHVKGSFTSAHANKEGKFIAAGRGTILLDEIDVLGLEQQVKLLRVIETGEFEPVGSNETLRSQARLVVASNLDLQPLVEQGRFRPDLYYRLNMLKFEIPPLRQRRPDIAILARKFVDQLAARHNIEIDQIDDAIYTALYNYPWPGNVRELENVIQRAVIYCHDRVLTVDHLPPHIIMGMAGPTNDPSVKLTPSPAKNSNHLNRQIAMTEKDIIEQTLFNNNFSRTNTAKELGISRVTLYNKMKKYGMTK